MDIRQLRTFLEAARHGSFKRAAAAVHLVQSSVSAQILALEEELGAPLFERRPRKVLLTATGESLLPYAERIVFLAEEAVGSLGASARLCGKLTICSSRNPWPGTPARGAPRLPPGAPPGVPHPQARQLCGNQKLSGRGPGGPGLRHRRAGARTALRGRNRAARGPGHCHGHMAQLLDGLGQGEAELAQAHTPTSIFLAMPSPRP